MRFLEKARELRPNESDNKIIGKCPDQLGLEFRSKCPTDENGEDKGCIDCWNREMPLNQ